MQYFIGSNFYRLNTDNTNWTQVEYQWIPSGSTGKFQFGSVNNRNMVIMRQYSTFQTTLLKFIMRILRQVECTVETVLFHIPNSHQMNFHLIDFSLTIFRIYTTKDIFSCSRLTA